MKILGISGSLREASLNSLLLRTMQARAPERVTVEIADLSAIPLYNEDLEDESGGPAAVADFKSAIEEADALIIATPEYNYSIPGVLKNALDWASRPGFESVLKHKPVGIISASPAFTGGVRAQHHLKAVLAGTLSYVVPMPEVAVPTAHKVVTDGEITDERTLRHLDGLLGSVMDAVH